MPYPEAKDFDLNRIECDESQVFIAGKPLFIAEATLPHAWRCQGCGREYLEAESARNCEQFDEIGFIASRLASLRHMRETIDSQEKRLFQRLRELTSRKDLVCDSE